MTALYIPVLPGYMQQDTVDNQRTKRSTPAFFISVLNQGFLDYSRKSARTERRQASGSANHRWTSYLVVKWAVARDFRPSVFS
jgi:hypothetical protein